jgi:hypothetical protein
MPDVLLSGRETIEPIYAEQAYAPWFYDMGGKLSGVRSVTVEGEVRLR